MNILSEFSSEEADSKEQLLNKTLPLSEVVKDEYAYIEEMFQDPKETDLRYLTLYNTIDVKRKNKWAKIHPDKLE